MYKRILSAVLMALAMLFSLSALGEAEAAVFLEGALRLEAGGALLYGARQEHSQLSAWYAWMDETGRIRWDKTVEGQNRCVEAMEWEKGMVLIAQNDADASCTLVCVNAQGEEQDAPSMPEGTGYLRLALGDVLAYGAYEGKDGGYVLRLSRVNEDGKVVWQRDYSAHAQGWHLPLAADDGEEIDFIGAWNQEEGMVYSVLEMDSAGQILWNTAIEADYVGSVQAGEEKTLVLGESEGSGFAMCLDGEGRQLWRLNVQEKLLDGVLTQEGAYLLTQSEGMVGVMLAGETGEILSQQMTEWTDAALARDGQGNAYLYAVSGSLVEQVPLEKQEREKETTLNSLQLSMEWIGMESEKTFQAENARIVQTVEAFLHDGKALEEAPKTGEIGQRRFEITTPDLNLELYWNALEEKAYLKAGEIWYELDAGHGEYLLSLCRALEDETCFEDIGESHEEYLGGFGWKIGWRIGRQSDVLPQRMLYTPQEESTLYWTYHAELIRLGGGSLEEAMGQAVEISVYAVYADAWQSPSDNKILRAVVLEKEGKILGGFLSQGYEAERAWSLTGQAMEENVNQWLLSHSEGSEPMDETPGAGDVLRRYLDAWQEKNHEAMLSCLAPQTALDEMIREARGKKLYETLEERLASGRGALGELEEVHAIEENGSSFTVSCKVNGENIKLKCALRQNTRGFWEIAEIRKTNW